jgi:hypothetical protein
MEQKRLKTFMHLNMGVLPLFFYRYRFIIVLVLSLFLLLTGCSKSKIQAIALTEAQSYFETNVLNRDFRVQLATDSGVDLTAQYSSYLFRLLENTVYDGQLTATIGSTVYAGTWSCNDDYSKLVISLPSGPGPFVFLNREWKFTKKSLPVMELAPWGTTDPKVLHMERQ